MTLICKIEVKSLLFKSLNHNHHHDHDHDQDHHHDPHDHHHLCTIDSKVAGAVNGDAEVRETTIMIITIIITMITISIMILTMIITMITISIMMITFAQYIAKLLEQFIVTRRWEAETRMVSS